jgi:hypothetical protein
MIPKKGGYGPATCIFGVWDDGMAEQEIHWLFGWHRGRFWLRSWPQVDPIFLHVSATNPTRSMTSMGQVTSKQPLIIIIWMHQEMMAWMSRKSIDFLDASAIEFFLQMSADK